MDSAESNVRTEAREAMLEIAREAARFFHTFDVREWDQAFRSELVASITERLRNDGTEPTIARLAMATGLSKSAVEQAIANRAAEQPARRTTLVEDGLIDGLATIASLWTSDPRFTAMYGVPRDLPIHKSLDNNESLESLAELALPGVSFQRVVDALKEHGLVELNQGIARLISQTIFYRNLDAHVVSFYGRMVTGLMRNLRLNRELKLHTSNDKPWCCALVMDRPIVDEKVPIFLDIVAESADRWFRNLESMHVPPVPRAGDDARRYAVCAFVSPEAPSSAGITPSVGAVPPKLYIRSIVTDGYLSATEAEAYRRMVAETGQAFFDSIDVEHKPLLAAPGAPGTRLVVCAYLFDVTGAVDTVDQSIDLLNPPAAHRRALPRQMR